MNQDWLNDFELSRILTIHEKNILNQSAHHKIVPAGEYVFQNGEPCHHILFVKKGCIRIQKLSEDGHILTLTRVGELHCCEMTVTSAITGDAYPAEAITEDDSHIILIPAKVVKRLMSTSSSWQSFLFREISQSLSELILLAEDVAFVPIDIRLARCLIEGINENNILRRTHSEIASDLGSAREVVSRTLKRFENNGYLILHRGWIEVTSPQALNNIFH